MKKYSCLILSIVMVFSTMTLGLCSSATPVFFEEFESSGMNTALETHGMFFAGMHRTIDMAFDEEWVLDQKLLASDGASDDWFGFSIDIDGEYAIIGAQWDDVNGIVNAGSAYIFHYDGEHWVEEAKLSASDGEEGDWFGHSVSISGQYAFISAVSDDTVGAVSGSVYVFKHEGTDWIEEQKILVQPDGGASAIDFGWSVCIEEDYALVGAINDDDCGDSSGSTYVFQYDDTRWNQVQKLLPADGKAWAFFGYCISIDGDSAIIGARCDEYTGAAYIFTLEGTTWVETQKLVAADGDGGDYFGKAVFLKGQYAIVGAHYDDDNGEESGSAYIFYYNGSSWIQQAKIIASDGEAEEEFGDAVYINDEYALVGVQFDDDQGMYSGSAYLFKRDGAIWVEQAKLLPPDGGYWQQFGNAVFMTDESAFVCSLYDDENGLYSGSTYIYKKIVREPDLECTGSLSWDAIEPEETVTGDFLVENVGDEGSLLNWEIQTYPAWGTWTFSPDAGAGLPTDKGTTVTVSVVAPAEKNTEFRGNVTVVNQDDPSDYCIIPVYLKTPVKHDVSFQWFFERLFERFPHAFPMLRYLLGY